jgi:N-acetylmuramoyl-L-alanine amidase
MIILSAGHCPVKGDPDYDPGACANGFTEAELTKDLRDRTVAHIKANRGQVMTDNDAHNLAEVIRHIASNEGDIVCDIHFNAGPEMATGVEVIYPYRSTQEERDLAVLLSDRLSKILGIKNRGAKDETHTARKSLAMMKPKGVNVLIEVCFISNPTDMKLYVEKKNDVAKMIADLLVVADSRA